MSNAKAAILTTAASLALYASTAGARDDNQYCDWRVEDFAIAAPLCGMEGDPERGRELVARKDKGNCLACHRMPIPEEPMHGTVGPPLHSVGARLSAGQIRLRVVDQRTINPNTIMPGFYRHPRTLNRPLPGLDRTILTAQEIEDVVAYLVTLQ